MKTTNQSQPPAAGEAAHTPTPWRVSAAGNIRPDDGTKAGLVIASPQREQDAAFIVRACNAYNSDQRKIAALVEALTQVRSFMSSGTPSSDESELLDVIEVAIAAAKEGQP